MHVGIFTYQTGHLKTWQMLQKMLAKSFKVTIYAFPFKHRESPKAIFEDRPSQLIELDLKDFCRRNGIAYVEMNGWTEEDARQLGQPGVAGTPDVFLTCIAKIVPGFFIHGRTILNVHPGLLPENRGVDAFKWSVVKKTPFAVTLHAIDERIDGGTILARKKIPVLPDDTLARVAERAYEIECDLQANFDLYLGNMKHQRVVSDEYELSKKKVPKDVERELERLFLESRDLFVELSAQPDRFPNSL